jgi:hypothetical protein
MEGLVGHLDALWDTLTITEFVFLTMTSKSMRAQLYGCHHAWIPKLQRAARRLPATFTPTSVAAFLKSIRHKDGSLLLNSRCHACLRPRSPSAMTTTRHVIHLCVQCAKNSAYHRLVTNNEIARARSCHTSFKRKGEWRLRASVINASLCLARRRPAGGAHLYWAFPLERLGLTF